MNVAQSPVTRLETFLKSRRFFILTVAAAESAIGLAILVVLFRQRRTINVEELDVMKG